MSKSNKKICFIASSGGHFEQLMMLEPLMKNYDSIIVTEKTKYSIESDVKTYYIKQVNRKEKACIVKVLQNFIKSLYIFIKEKPDYTISTGVLATIPMCLITKMFKRKLIYIESFAKITSPTMSGKLLYKCADRFYVQWEKLLEIYPNAIYKGGIY